MRAVPRVAALLVITALVAATVVVGQAWRPGASPAPVSVTLPLSASAAVPVCPGPQGLQAPDGAVGFAAGGPTVVGALAVPDGLLAADGRVEAAERAGTLRRELAEGAPLVLDSDLIGGTGSPGFSGGGVPAVAGTQLTLARTGDLRGLSATACGVASTQAWLVGGGTRTGRRARLLLANPAPAPAVVDVRVVGPAGAVDVPAGQGLVVPAGGQRAVLVDALAPGLDALAIHVIARSGRVVAGLHDELVRGLAPGGTDSVTPAAPPSTRQLVPGLAVEVGSAASGGPTDPGATAVRVVVPGTSSAVVRVRLLGPDGPVDLPGAVRQVAAGTVVDLPVTGVPAAVYTAVVEADVPVLAAGLLGRVAPVVAGARPLPGDGPVAELAWAPSSAGLDGMAGGTAVVATPAVPGVQAALALGTLDGARVTVVPLSAQGVPGSPSTLDLVAGTTTSISLPADAAGALLRGLTGQLHAALVLTAADPKGPLVAVVAVVAVRSAAGSSTGAAPAVVQDPRLGLL